MQKIINNTARKIIRTTIVEIVYNPLENKHKKWAIKINKSLTDKKYELEDFAPGRVTYTKSTIKVKEEIK